jgi:uncharacterized membrane protein
MILGYAILYCALSWLRFATFHAQIDMSFYLRLIWGVGHGHPDLPLVRAPHYLGLHLEPVVFPLAALSRLGVPLAPLLLGMQAIAVAYMALPAYRLGARHLGPGLPALCAAACALLYPTVTVATLHDFHPVTLALPLLLGVVDAVDEGAHRRALLLGALALCCREDIAVQLGLLCLLVAASARTAGGRRVRIAALCLFVALLSYFFIYVLFVQPRWLPPFGSYGLHFRIGGAARSARDVVALGLYQPLVLVRHLLSGDRLLYPYVLLWPVAFLPVLAPRYLLGALPIVGINLLSDFPRVRTIEAHYATAIVPFVVAAAIIGAGRALRLARGARQGFLRASPLWLLCLCVLAAHVGHGGSPLALGSKRYNPRDFRDEENAGVVRAALRRIPPGVSVAARPGPLAHMAERPRFISPPEYEDGRPAEYILKVY